MPSSRPLKRRRFHYPPAFWSVLTKIWLEPDALWEFNRRNRVALRSQHVEPKKELFQYAPDFLRDCSPAQLKEIKSFAKSGGPDLTDLRSYGVPQAMSSSSSSETTSDTALPRKTTATAALPADAEDSKHDVDGNVTDSSSEIVSGLVTLPSLAQAE